MRVDISSDTQVIALTLSRRNLEALLVKLDIEWSAREIGSANWYRDGEPCNGYIRVIAEDNDTHYGRENREAGLMHPETEARMVGSDG